MQKSPHITWKIVARSTSLISLFVLIASLVQFANSNGAIVPSMLPSVHALDTLTIPKLSYNPTMEQLKTDQNLQKEFLAFNLKTSSKATTIYGQGAIAFDDNFTDIIGAKTEKSLQPHDILLSVGIDRNNTGGYPASKSAFIVNLDWNIDSKNRTGQLYLGTGQGEGFGTPQVLTFPWDAAYSTSYFSQGQNNSVLFLRIPNSFMGPGDFNHTYRLFIGMVENHNSGRFPSVPNDAAGIAPSTWQPVTTSPFAIPAFPIRWEQPTAALAIALASFVSLHLRKTRRTATEME